MENSIFKKTKQKHNLKHLEQETHIMKFHCAAQVYVLTLILLTTKFVVVGSMSLAELKDELQNETSLKKRQTLKEKYEKYKDEYPGTSIRMFFSPDIEYFR